MTSRAWLHMAAAGAMLMVFAVAAALLPADRLNANVLAAIILLAASLAFALYLPRTGGAGGEQVGLVLLGPVGVLNSFLVLGSVLALYVGLIGHDGLGWALIAATVGIGVIGWSLLQAAVPVAVSAMQAAEQPSVHNAWIMQMNGMVLSCEDAPTQQQLAALAEQLRYVARDVPGAQLQENVRVSGLLAALPAAVAPSGSEMLPGLLRDIQAALAQREMALKALRTRM